MTMLVPVDELPDVIGALIERLMDAPPIDDLCHGRVSGELKEEWGMSARPKFAIVVEGPSGGPGEQGPGLYRDRYDIVAYGPGTMRPKQLMRRIRAYLVPVPHGRVRANGFVAAHTNVLGIDEEAAPFALADPNTKWTTVRLPIIVTYSAVPV